jgi:hypothetical protein
VSVTKETLMLRGSPSNRIPMGFLKTWVAVAAFGIFPAAAADAQLSIAGPEEVVVRWQTDRCSDTDFPDMPARIFRDDKGDTKIVATHYDNRLMTLLPDGRIVKGDCGVVLASRNDAVSTNYADKNWLSSVWSDDGTTVHAVIHHEYQAHQHDGACALKGYAACWFNTLTYARSDDGGRTFKQSNPPAVIASAPFTQDYGQGRHRGFFEPTNIIKQGANWLFLANTTGWPGQPPGYCLFRTSEIADPSSWRAWDGRGFTAAFPAPASHEPPPDGPHCAPVFTASLGSILWLEDQGQFLAVAVHQTPNTAPTRFDVVTADSNDLIHWGPVHELLQIAHGSSKSCADKARYMYPSLVAHRGDTATGENPKLYLYMTRMNVQDCKTGNDRDLVRYRIDRNNNGADPATIKPPPER